MNDADTPPTVEFLLGRCDEMRAEVFVQVARTAGGESAPITGTLTGPRRGRDTMLPVTARLQPTPNPGVARAILTEPAYWTPDLPNLYRLEATVGRPDGSPLLIDRLVGLRRLGVRGRSLWLDGHRWVPRGIGAGAADLTACKAASVAAVMSDPDEQTLTHADETGVAVIALVDASMAGDPDSLAHRIAAWAAHPSAVVVILPMETPAANIEQIAAAVRQHKGTLLLALAVAGAEPPPAATPPGIDALVVVLDGAAAPHETWRTGGPVPLFACRRNATSPMTGRAPCDALQAALAAWGAADGSDQRPWDWAGYLVAKLEAR